MKENLIALIYTRVSSISQKTEGSGNESQEIRCRDYAKQNNWTIEKVFEDAYTGAGDFMNRTAMRELIIHIKKNKDKNFVVIFDDLKRLSRDTLAFINLSNLFKDLNVKLECLNHKLDDSPEGEFISTILAAQGQLERKQNARQVIQKTEAHLMNGDMPYKPPIGYTNVKVETVKRKVCKIDINGSGIRDGLNGFASGRFKNITELGRYFIENKYIKNNTRNGMYDKTRSILGNIFYAGYINYPKKNINMIKGNHEPLITLETWKINQEKIKKQDRGEKAYQLYREEFELRQLIRCVECGRKLASSTSKGRSKYYSYYTCQTTGCNLKNKNLPVSRVHNLFYSTLGKIESSQSIIDLAIESFNEAFVEAVTLRGLNKENVNNQIRELDSKIESYINTLEKLENITVIKSIENKITELELEKKILEEKLNTVSNIDEKSRTALENMKECLKNPLKTWNICNIKQKRELYRFIFSEDFKYAEKDESRTTPLTPLYSYFTNPQSLLVNDNVEKLHDGARSWT